MIALYPTILALATLPASAYGGPLATPGQYSLTVYDPSFHVVYQVEQPQATINPSTVYEIYPETSITVGATSYLLTNITIFGSGSSDLQIPGPEPTAIYAAGGNFGSGPWDAIFGIVYDSRTSTWDGNNVNYYLGFSAGPPGTGTPYGPGGADTYASESSGPFFSATQYLNPSLQGLGYTAYFYDPASVSVPEPSCLFLMTLGVGGAVLGRAGLRRLGESRRKVA